MLSIAVRDSPLATTLRLAGELDMETVPELVTCVEEQLQHGNARLVIDMHALMFCDSRGLATLLQAAMWCRERGGSLSLAGASGGVALVLSITGVDELLATGGALGGRSARPQVLFPPLAG